MEELEAVDWYDQRIDATADAELADAAEEGRDSGPGPSATSLRIGALRDKEAL